MSSYSLPSDAMNTSKSLDSVLNNLVDKTFGLHSLKEKEVAKARKAIVEAVEGIYGDSDGLREFASTPTNQAVNPNVNKRKEP